VAAAISGYEVMIKKIELPMMTEEELHNRMRVELGQYIPYNVDEVDVDYQIMDVARDRPSNMDVLLVASKKESISDHVNLIRLSGFEPTVVDVDFFALSNAFEATHGLSDDSVALVDIGANKAIMNIVSRGVPLFTRGISIGGNQISDRIRDRFKVSEEDAERVKMNDIPASISSKEVGDIFVSVVRNWVSEFKRAVDFYYSNFPDKQIKQVYLSGGSCRIPGLDKVFQETINAKVDIFNPLARLEYDSRAFDSAYIDYVGPQMAISLGLALRKTKEK
jgi:type IV pilus assembly protein PilM